MAKMPPALFALALCAFSIGTTELVIVGLLPEVSADLGVTIPAAGMLVTGYALGVVFGGPVLTAATIGLPKKPLLIGLMAVFVAGNALAAAAPSYWALMAGRVGLRRGRPRRPPGPDAPRPGGGRCSKRRP